MISSQEIIESIAADNTSGAAILYRRSIDFFRAVLAENQSSDSTSLTAMLSEAARRVSSAQPAMAPLIKVAYQVKATVDQAASRDEDVASMIGNLLNRQLQESETAPERIASNASGLIPEGSTIVTISFSSAVLNTILHHPMKNSLTVVTPESRPVCEGVLFAKTLDEMGVRCILSTDFRVFSHLENADMFLCGADAVTEDYLVNKTGTGILARTCMETCGNSVALFDESKILPAKMYRFSQIAQPAGEITNNELKRGVVENYYFEKCPLSCFSKFVTPAGSFTQVSLRSHILRMSESNLLDC